MLPLRLSANTQKSSGPGLESSTSLSFLEPLMTHPDERRQDVYCWIGLFWPSYRVSGLIIPHVLLLLPSNSFLPYIDWAELNLLYSHHKLLLG